MAALNPETMAEFRRLQPHVEPVLKWIEALRSGRYLQVFGRMGSGCERCATGVAVATLGERTAELVIFPGHHGGWLRHVVQANDKDNWTFAQIADWLETAINLQRLIDLLTALPDIRFDMTAWRRTAGGTQLTSLDDASLLHNCGTKACIAGWGAIFAPPGCGDSPLYRATHALGLNHDQALDLFQPGEHHSKDRTRAIETLTRFRDTGVISWA